MFIKPRRSGRAALLSALVAGLFAVEISADVLGGALPGEYQAQFRVWLDAREIGTHRVRVGTEDGQTLVQTEADFQVKAWFVKVFSYRHVAQETWRGNCLLSLKSSTVTNGKRHVLEVNTRNDRPVLARATEVPEVLNQELPACVGSYAYWDLDRLNRDLLLNSQTGRLSAAQLEYVGNSLVPKSDLLARQYLLRTGEGEIELWYNDADQWIGLATLTEGKRLVYLSTSAKPAI